MAFEGRDLRYTYPSSRFSVHACELRINKGECVALTGKNGSGKTTLGKLMGGLLRPDSGSVRIDGESTAGWALGRIGRRVGYLFQESAHQLFAPIVLEDLAFPLELLGMAKPQAERRASETLRAMELLHLARHSTYTLSRGEQQRLAIGALLQNSPSYLILDEPTTGLDRRRRQLLAELLEALMGQGIGLLLISHDRGFVERLGSRPVAVEGGRLLDP